MNIWNWPLSFQSYLYLCITHRNTQGHKLKLYLYYVWLQCPAFIILNYDFNSDCCASGTTIQPFTSCSTRLKLCDCQPIKEIKGAKNNTRACDPTYLRVLNDYSAFSCSCHVFVYVCAEFRGITWISLKVLFSSTTLLTDNVCCCCCNTSA